MFAVQSEEQYVVDLVQTLSPITVALGFLYEDGDYGRQQQIQWSLLSHCTFWHFLQLSCRYFDFDDG